MSLLKKLMADFSGFADRFCGRN